MPPEITKSDPSSAMNDTYSSDLWRSSWAARGAEPEHQVEGGRHPEEQRDEALVAVRFPEVPGDERHDGDREQHPRERKRRPPGKGERVLHRTSGPGESRSRIVRQPRVFATAHAARGSERNGPAAGLAAATPRRFAARRDTPPTIPIGSQLRCRPLKERRMSHRIAFRLVLGLALCAFARPADAVPRSVVNTNDSGAGSLRAAITAATAGDVIDFAIPGDAVHTISPLTALPPLAAGVTIDATGQTGANCANWPPSLRIEVDGGSTSEGTHGLTIGGNGVVVRGLVINSFPDDGIHFQNGASGGDDRVQLHRKRRDRHARLRQRRHRNRAPEQRRHADRPQPDLRQRSGRRRDRRRQQRSGPAPQLHRHQRRRDGDPRQLRRRRRRGIRQHDRRDRARQRDLGQRRERRRPRRPEMPRATSSTATRSARMRRATSRCRTPFRACTSATARARTRSARSRPAPATCCARTVPVACG